MSDLDGTREEVLIAEPVVQRVIGVVNHWQTGNATVYYFNTETIRNSRKRHHEHMGGRRFSASISSPASGHRSTPMKRGVRPEITLMSPPMGGSWPTRIDSDWQSTI